MYEPYMRERQCSQVRNKPSDRLSGGSVRASVYTPLACRRERRTHAHMEVLFKLAPPTCRSRIQRERTSCECRGPRRSSGQEKTICDVRSRAACFGSTAHRKASKDGGLRREKKGVISIFGPST